MSQLAHILLALLPPFAPFPLHPTQSHLPMTSPDRPNKSVMNWPEGHTSAQVVLQGEVV